MTPDDDKIVAERLSELKALYQFAKEKIFAIEEIGEGAFVPAINELRNAGEHILNASTASSSDRALAEIAKAEGHCWRAISDCTDTAVMWSLKRLRKFQDDYRLLPVAEYVPAYGEILGLAQKIQAALADHQSKDIRQHYQELERLLPQLVTRIREIEGTRSVLNEKLKAQQRKSKRWLVALALGISSSVAASFIFDALVQKAKPQPQDIQTEIANLAKIQSSLAQLQVYVGSQQARLETINSDIQNLTDKKQRLEKAVNVSEQAVQELLRRYESQPKGISWFDQGLSFVVGFLASLFVVFFVAFLKRRKLIDPET